MTSNKNPRVARTYSRRSRTLSMGLLCGLFLLVVTACVSPVSTTSPTEVPIAAKTSTEQPATYVAPTTEYYYEVKVTGKDKEGVTIYQEFKHLSLDTPSRLEDKPVRVATLEVALVNTDGGYNQPYQALPVFILLSVQKWEDEDTSMHLMTKAEEVNHTVSFGDIPITLAVLRVMATKNEETIGIPRPTDPSVETEPHYECEVHIAGFDEMGTQVYRQYKWMTAGATVQLEPKPEGMIELSVAINKCTEGYNTPWPEGLPRWVNFQITDKDNNTTPYGVQVLLYQQYYSIITDSKEGDLKITLDK
ncbi:hypothetical protein JW710_02980 [Candidatus Dojkabacteria bacterium]|nr:hypothetical protein [Candidatus Dojkabacteria bacterium]